MAPVCWACRWCGSGSIWHSFSILKFLAAARTLERSAGGSLGAAFTVKVEAIDQSSPELTWVGLVVVGLAAEVLLVLALAVEVLGWT